MIRFNCPICGKELVTPDEAAGKTGKCACGESLRVPIPTSIVAPNQVVDPLSAPITASVQHAANPPSEVVATPPKAEQLSYSEQYAKMKLEEEARKKAEERRKQESRRRTESIVGAVFFV